MPIDENNMDAPTYGWAKVPGGKLNSKAAQQSAARAGNTDTENKFGAANHSLGPTNAKKLDEDEGNYKHREIPHEFKKALMQARAAKKLTQKELAQLCNLPAGTIQEYESGKAVPEGAVISKLNRHLGVTLPKVPKKKAAKE